MIMCDGSLILLQAVVYSFCKVSLGQLLQIYYEVVTGKLRDEEFKIPILPLLEPCNEECQNLL